MGITRSLDASVVLCLLNGILGTVLGSKLIVVGEGGSVVAARTGRIGKVNSLEPGFLADAKVVLARGLKDGLIFMSLVMP